MRQQCVGVGVYGRCVECVVLQQAVSNVIKVVKMRCNCVHGGMLRSLLLI